MKICYSLDLKFPPKAMCWKLGCQLMAQLECSRTFEIQGLIFKGNNNYKCWWECYKTGILLQCWWECILVQPLCKAVWRGLKKLKIELTYDPVTFLLGMYWKEHKWGYNRDPCTSKFITAVFTIVKLWKQPRCPTTDEWIKKMWYIYTIEFYSVIRNDMRFGDKWIQLEDTMLSEVRQAQKDKGHMFSLKCGG
jgi:hypothetical protein